MKSKTRDKLDRRLMNLPLHHIDTSILLEPERTENGRACRKYLQKVGYNFRGVISFPVLSEVLSVILSFENYSERQNLLEIIFSLVNIRKINFYTPKNTEEILMKIKEIDKMIIGLDREILACSIENKAMTLITLDKTLINNEKIEKEFNIKIKHPKDLL